ncbi:MAG TPA: universal stress protein [Blastocatellia bacterium]|jgi:nucleotide-binding universal stress UspA family protein
MKILVAIDSSASSATVLDEVKSRSWPEDSQIQLLNVADTTGIISVKGDLQQFMRAQVEAALSMVRAAAERIAPSAQGISSLVIEGYPPQVIVEHAREWGADFIFVGSHGHGALARFFLGSVASYVLRHAHCSVVIARPSDKAVAKKILFATDGSDASLSTARSVAARKWPVDAEFEVLGVIEEIVPAIDPWYGGGVAIVQIQEEAEKVVREGVKSSQRIFLDAGLKATAAVVNGHPKAAIVNEVESWGASLVIVGSHGQRGLTRLLMGSVSEAVAMHAPCSVEVIREQPLYG